jgi:hypothetical protein
MIAETRAARAARAPVRVAETTDQADIVRVDTIITVRAEAVQPTDKPAAAEAVRRSDRTMPAEIVPPEPASLIQIDPAQPVRQAADARPDPQGKEEPTNASTQKS